MKSASFTPSPLLDLVESLTSSPEKVRSSSVPTRRRSNSLSSRWSLVDCPQDFVKSIAQLVYHSLYSKEKTSQQRRALAKVDPWSRLNPTIEEDIRTLVLPRTIEAFLKSVVSTLKLESEIQVQAMVLLDRLLGEKSLCLHHANWKPVLISVLMVSCKAYDDQAVWNSDFVRCQPGLTCSILKRLESLLLTQLEFRLTVSVSSYEKYRFELKHLQSTTLSLEKPNFGLAQRCADVNLGDEITEPVWAKVDSM